ncbi:MAG: LysM peptidoglycan-binding domain-containing protein [Nitrospiraceae bacterium]|nr:LysM peptidoglycan-binding domain-containing protein [Nitrospiraceae bacterium]
MTEPTATPPAATATEASTPGPAAAAPEAAKTQQAAAAPAEPAEQQNTYLIREGDTLWDISSAQYKDPFLWPLIWKANPSIADPDLIYPGVTLNIPSLAPVERAMNEPQEAPPAEEKAVPAAPAPQVAEEPSKPEAAETSSFFKKKVIESSGPEPEEPVQGVRIIAPEEGPQPIADKFTMLRLGFIGEADTDDRVVSSVDDTAKDKLGLNLLGWDQNVFVRIDPAKNPSIGDRFLVYKRVYPVKHPITKEYVGNLYKIRGIVKLIKSHSDQEAGLFTAKITMSFDSMIQGDMLMPYQDPVLIYPNGKKNKTISGRVLDVTDTRTLSGDFDEMYIDKGKEDGVEPGDRFRVYTKEDNSLGVPKLLGEAQVLLVKDKTATAVIKKSNDTMNRGDRIEYLN